jgi:hypothetical protein
MAMSNVWTNEEYRNKIVNLFQNKNAFECSSFFERHMFSDIELQTEDNINDHDVTIVDELTFEVFVEHLSCYFSN